MTTAIKIEAKATPYVVSAEVPTADLVKARDDYWNEFAKNIPENVVRAAKKGGFREATRERVIQVMGGPNQFYRNPVVKFISQTFGKTEQGEVLTFGAIRIAEGKEKAQIECEVYFEPHVKWTSVTDDKVALPHAFKLQLPPITDEAIEENLKYRYKQQQDKHAVFSPAGDGPAVDGQFVVADIHFDKNDRGFKNSSKVKVEVGPQIIPAINDALKLCKKGERISFNFDAPVPDDERKVQISGSVKVHDIFNRVTPNVDNDLAVSSGFTDLAHMGGVYRREIEDEATKTRENQVLALVFKRLNDLCTVDPVPSQWADAKAYDLFEQQKQIFGGEKQVLQMLGVPDASNVIELNAADIARQFIRSLIFRAYGVATGIEGDHSLNATHKYADAVMKEILKSRVTVEDLPEAKEATDAAPASN